MDVSDYRIKTIVLDLPYKYSATYIGKQWLYAPVNDTNASIWIPYNQSITIDWINDSSRLNSRLIGLIFLTKRGVIL